MNVATLTINSDKSKHKALPCPFCGSTQVVHRGLSLDCTRCGCFGPTAREKERAIMLWNQRATSAQEDLVQ